MDRFVCHVDFALKLPETRIKAEKRVDREQPPAECNLRVSEDRASLVVERAVTILTEIPLKLSVAAVSDRPVRTAVRTGHTVTPANLLEQVRCDRFRPEHI